MDFADIKGHEEIKRRIRSAIESRSYSHAYLFMGGRGLGKLKMARLLARGILCQGDGAGVCRACQLMDQGDHPDYKEVTPDKKGGGGTIKKETMEAILEDGALSSYYGQGKVYVIDDFDRVSPGGQNALLKTLEEPREGTYFILVSANPEGVLETVQSRCQKFYFSPLSPQEIEEGLIEAQLDPQLAQMVTAFAGGSLDRALAYGQDPQSFRRRKDFFFHLDQLVREGAFRTYDLEAFFKEEKDHIDELFYLLEAWARDLYIYQETGDISLVSNQDMAKDLEAQVTRLGQRAKEIYDRVLKARSYLKNNGNQELILEALFLYIGGS
ncbi:MAG: DNA polymerase III subunit delta' [Tissierellia bacterium]|nr:DNA polymerase III subunit delta' [Tissierellia bacterium]